MPLLWCLFETIGAQHTSRPFDVKTVFDHATQRYVGMHDIARPLARDDAKMTRLNMLADGEYQHVAESA